MSRHYQKPNVLERGYNSVRDIRKWQKHHLWQVSASSWAKNEIRRMWAALQLVLELKEQNHAFLNPRRGKRRLTDLDREIRTSPIAPLTSTVIGDDVMLFPILNTPARVNLHRWHHCVTHRWWAGHNTMRWGYLHHHPVASGWVDSWSRWTGSSGPHREQGDMFVGTIESGISISLTLWIVLQFDVVIQPSPDHSSGICSAVFRFVALPVASFFFIAIGDQH